jgi:hypothetical protein
VVPYALGEALFAAAGEPKRFLHLPGTDATRLKGRHPDRSGFCRLTAIRPFEAEEPPPGAMSAARIVSDG